MEFIISNSEKITAVLLLIGSGLGLRILLEATGQRWVTTYAHTATMVLLPVITYVITKVISGNIALSLGMVGALSIVRFRNPVRSPLELSAYFAAITMGIAASVSLSWLVFFVASILLVIVCLGLASAFCRLILKKPFFTASFSEGNSLSTLEVTSLRGLVTLDQSSLLKSKSVSEAQTKYLLVSPNFEVLKQVVEKLEADDEKVQYQLNA